MNKPAWMTKDDHDDALGSNAPRGSRSRSDGASVAEILLFFFCGGEFLLYNCRYSLANLIVQKDSIDNI